MQFLRIPWRGMTERWNLSSTPVSRRTLANLIQRREGARSRVSRWSTQLRCRKTW